MDDGETEPPPGWRLSGWIARVSKAPDSCVESDSRVRDAR